MRPAEAAGVLAAARGLGAASERGDGPGGGGVRPGASGAALDGPRPTARASRAWSAASLPSSSSSSSDDEDEEDADDEDEDPESDEVDDADGRRRP
uniref:Uncharacterized protein n=1 Tax=Human herpesvirus 1 TaxID=10298 RepID=A0A2Z4H1M2_HHV1|nr:hypothetical protein [Human alphaherpesvirus 1]